MNSKIGQFANFATFHKPSRQPLGQKSEKQPEECTGRANSFAPSLCKPPPHPTSPDSHGGGAIPDDVFRAYFLRAYLLLVALGAVAWFWR